MNLYNVNYAKNTSMPLTTTIEKILEKNTNKLKAPINSLLLLCLIFFMLKELKVYTQINFDQQCVK